MYSFLDYTLKIVYKNSSKYYKCYICLDNLYTGSKNNIREIISHPNFEFIRHDVTFPFYFEIDGIL